MVSGEQIFMGSATAVLCAVGLWNESWLLTETGKGRALVRWFGPDRARWVLRLLLASGMILGTLLAVGIVNPIQW